MAASPAKFFFGFLILSIVLWMIFVICSRFFAWILSRVLGASVVFRVGGWKCLRDVVVKFNKGAIESVSAGEIKLSLRQSLVKLGVGFLSRDPKVQVLICDLEVVMRSSTSTKNVPKAKSRKPRNSGRGKWMVVANIARFLSVSVSDMVVKNRKAVMEVKELKLDISKDGGTKPNLYVELHVLPILVHLCESRMMSDQSSSSSFERSTASQTTSATSDRSSAALFCDDLSLSTEFGHDRAVGIFLRNVEVISGDVTLTFDEDSFPKSKQSSSTLHSDEVVTSTKELIHLPRNLLKSINWWQLSQNILRLFLKWLVWSMIVDGKSFAEAEINGMIYDIHRDYKDIGVSRFTTKSFVLKNCLPHAKSSMLLSAWNPPSENFMLHVDTKQGAPKDGHYPLELFHATIYPLRIHLTETMYRMMWKYFFPEEEQDSQRRQEVWKISKPVKKGLAGHMILLQLLVTPMLRHLAGVLQRSLLLPQRCHKAMLTLFKNQIR